MRIEAPNILLVAGDGRKSGKTTMACRIISDFAGLYITAIKITLHFHEPSAGLVIISSGEGFCLYEETDRQSDKDSSLMLKSGASRVLYAQVSEGRLGEAFKNLLQHIPQGTLIVCESQSLIRYIKPGVFIIMVTVSGTDRKDISDITVYPHLKYSLAELQAERYLPLKPENGRWNILSV